MRTGGLSAPPPFELRGELVSWVRVRRGVRGEPVWLLDPLRTGGNPISEWDVRWAKRTGRFPGHAVMAGDPKWFSEPWWPVTTPQLTRRREFDRWVRETARPGPKPKLTYDEVLTVRRVKNFLDVPADIRWNLKRAAYHHVRSFLTYWWVEGTNPEWVGYDWTFKGGE
jgi:hypothetical protein